MVNTTPMACSPMMMASTSTTARKKRVIVARNSTAVTTSVSKRRVGDSLRDAQRQPVVALRNEQKASGQAAEFRLEVDTLLLVDHRHRLDVPPGEPPADLVLHRVVLVTNGAEDPECQQAHQREDLTEVVIPIRRDLPPRRRDQDDHKTGIRPEGDAIAFSFETSVTSRCCLDRSPMMGSVVCRTCELERPVLAQSSSPRKNAQSVSSARMYRCVGKIVTHGRVMSCDGTDLSSGVLVTASCFSKGSWSLCVEMEPMGLLEMSRRTSAVVLKTSSRSCWMSFSVMSSPVSLYMLETGMRGDEGNEGNESEQVELS